jgi:hypothetical protein
MSIILTIAVCLVVLFFHALILCSCHAAHKADERSKPVEFVRFSVESLARVYYRNLGEMPYGWQQSTVFLR